MNKIFEKFKKKWKKKKWLRWAFAFVVFLSFAAFIRIGEELGRKLVNRVETPQGTIYKQVRYQTRFKKKREMGLIQKFQKNLLFVEPRLRSLKDKKEGELVLAQGELKKGKAWFHLPISSLRLEDDRGKKLPGIKGDIKKSVLEIKKPELFMPSNPRQFLYAGLHRQVKSKKSFDDFRRWSHSEEK